MQAKVITFGKQKMKKETNKIYIDGLSWTERELSQIIRRKMITKEERNKKLYTRKTKHKSDYEKNI